MQQRITLKNMVSKIIASWILTSFFFGHRTAFVNVYFKINILFLFSQGVFFNIANLNKTHTFYF